MHTPSTHLFMCTYKRKDKHAHTQDRERMAELVRTEEPQLVAMAARSVRPALREGKESCRENNLAEQWETVYGN